MSTTSKRPIVAKLCFHFTPGHSFFICSDTDLASLVKSLGSLNAVGEHATENNVSSHIFPPKKIFGNYLYGFRYRIICQPHPRFSRRHAILAS